MDGTLCCFLGHVHPSFTASCFTSGNSAQKVGDIQNDFEPVKHSLFTTVETAVGDLETKISRIRLMNSASSFRHIRIR